MAITVAHGKLPDIMLQSIAFAPRPGAAQMAMTMTHGNLLQGICMCTAPGCGAHGNDSGAWQST
eukprot:1731275-Karenia_brevis.AAC.1